MERIHHSASVLIRGETYTTQNKNGPPPSTPTKNTKYFLRKFRNAGERRSGGLIKSGREEEEEGGEEEDRGGRKEGVQPAATCVSEAGEVVKVWVSSPSSMEPIPP